MRAFLSKILNRNRGFEFTANSHVPGWFSPAESSHLYLAIGLNPQIKTILEIGHFQGRSTFAICGAIKDSGIERVFDSYDLPFTNEKEFTSFYDEVHQTSTSPSLLYRELYRKNLTSTQQAVKYLQAAGYIDFVNLNAMDYSKDFKTYKYDFIFSDAMHEPNEIRHHLPILKSKGHENTIWALHDMDSRNILCVEDHSVMRSFAQIGSLAFFSSMKTLSNKLKTN